MHVLGFDPRCSPIITNTEQAKNKRTDNYSKLTVLTTQLWFGADTARRYAGKYCSKPETADGQGTRNSHLEQGPLVLGGVYIFV